MERSSALLAAASVAAFLAATAVAAPLTGKQVDAVRAKSVVMCRREPRDFQLRTIGRSLASTPLLLLGIPGLVADAGATNANVKHAGEKIRERFQIADPAIQVSRQLAERLAGPEGLGNLTLLDLEQPTDWDKASKYRAITPDGAYVVEVQTIAWGIFHLDSKWDRYRIYYEARVSVLDPWHSRELTTVRASYKEPFENAE